MFNSIAYCRVPVSSKAPLPSLHMPAMVEPRLSSSMRTTANTDTRAFGPAMFRSPVRA